MLKDKFETIIKEHAGEIFGQDAALPDGHRKRFEQRLADRTPRTDSAALAGSAASRELAVDRRHVDRVTYLKKWLTAAAAAVLAGILFLLNRPADEPHGTELADVRNYYSMQLEEQADATRHLALNVDDACRETLLAGIERIENIPIPEVQIPDDEYIVLIATVYENKMEALQNIQNIIRERI
jgi:hypothetical protein